MALANFLGEGSEITAAGGKAYFTVSGRLWVNDGTVAGTRELPFQAVQKVNWLGTLAFVGRRDGETAYSLWQTNGTNEGTAQVAPLPVTDYTPASGLTVYRDSLYFAVHDDTHGNELWSSDGTAAGTGLVQDIYARGSSYPRFLTAAGDRLFFTAYDGPPEPAGGGPTRRGVSAGRGPLLADEPVLHGREVWVLSLPRVGR